MTIKRKPPTERERNGPWTPVEQLSDSNLWDLYLIPIPKNMPQNMKDYFEEVKKEFDKRDIKLKPIMNCDYGGEK